MQVYAGIEFHAAANPLINCKGGIQFVRIGLVFDNQIDYQ